MGERSIEGTSSEDTGRKWGPGSREWWYPRLLMAAIVALGAFGLWVYQHRNDTLRTQRLEIVDAQGKVCAVLGAAAHGEAGLVLADSTGQTRAALSVDRNGNPALTLRGADGAERAGMVISPNGHSALRLLNDRGQVRVALQVDNEGRSVVKVTGKYGKSLAALTYDGSYKSDVMVKNGVAPRRTPESPWQASHDHRTDKAKPKTGVRLSSLGGNLSGAGNKGAHLTVSVAE